MKIYSRRGDKGITSTISSSDIPKNHPLLEAIGTLDELSSWLGYVGTKMKMEDSEYILNIQKDIYKISSYVAGGRKPVMSKRVEEIEKRIDKINDELQPLRSFIYPGGTEISALIHIARSVCRRAERRLVELKRDSLIELDETIKYINRLSDYLFVLARKYNKKERIERILK